MRHRQPTYYEQLPENKKHALARISTLLSSGHFDYSIKAYIALVSIGLASLWPAIESVRLYLTIGREGTQFVPPQGLFNDTVYEEIGAIDAFSCNLVLNFYFMMDTAIRIRTAYLNYQARKKLGVPYSYREIAEIALKIVIATVISGFAGAVFAIIAAKDSDLPPYNQFITGAVNTLLFFLGSLALVNFIIYAKKYVNDCCKKKNTEEKSTTDYTIASLKAEESAIRDISNENTLWTELDEKSDFLKYILSEKNETDSLVPSETKSCSPKSLIPKLVYIFVYIFMQICSAASLSGYYCDTLNNVGKLLEERFGIPNRGPSILVSWILGTAFFIPFFALCCKVVHDTAQGMKDLVITRFKSLTNCENTQETYKKILFDIGTDLLSIVFYVISYFTSNSSLGLNAKYGLNHPVIVYPTVIGVTEFNGFAYSDILRGFGALLMAHTIYSPEKRSGLKKHRTPINFFESNRGIVKRMTDEIPTGVGSLNTLREAYTAV